MTPRSKPRRRKITDQTILERARTLVEKQAEDGLLWFNAETAPEAYLQQELRKLHAVIEDNEADLNLFE